MVRAPPWATSTAVTRLTRALSSSVTSLDHAPPSLSAKLTNTVKPCLGGQSTPPLAPPQADERSRTAAKSVALLFALRQPAELLKKCVQLNLSYTRGLLTPDHSQQLSVRFRPP